MLAVALALAALAAGGCVRYEPRPLVAEELVRALEARSPAEAGVSVDSTAALSLRDAELIALFYNPALRTARLRAAVPVLAAREAGRWDDPTLSLDALRILRSVDDPWIVGGALSFTLPISGRLAIERERAAAAGAAALVEAWGAEQGVLREVREAWIAWEAAARSAEAARALAAQIDDVAAIAARLEAAGELLAAEGIAFRLSQARARLEADKLATAAARARLTLLGSMGLLPGIPVEFAASVPEPVPEDLATATLLERHPLVLLRAAEYEVAEQRLRLEVRRQFPDLELGPAYENEEGQSRVGLGLSLPLPVLNANRPAIVEADAEREAARAAWEEAVQGALAAWAATRAEADAARRRLAAMEATVVPLAAQQLDEARRLAERGEVNALLLLEALDAQREATLERIEAGAEVARADAALRALAPEEAPHGADDDPSKDEQP